MFLNDNYGEWRLIMEQASSKSELTPNSLKSIPVNNSTIKKYMYKVLEAPGYTSTTKKDLDTLFKVFPNIGEALIKKKGIKNLFEYYQKAGQHQINISQLPEDGSGPHPKYLLQFGELNTIIAIDESGDGKKIYTYSSSKEFLNWYHSFNLDQWSNNKRIVQLSAVSKNQLNSRGIKVVTGAKTGGRGMNATRLGAKPINTYTLKRGGKDVEYATYIILGNKSIFDYEGGKDLGNSIIREFRLNDNVAQSGTLKQAFIPYMIIGYQSSEFSNRGILQSIYVESDPKITSRPLNLIATKTEKDIKVKEVDNPPRIWKQPGGFETGKFKVEDSKEAKDFIDRIVTDIQEYSKGKKSVNLDSVIITSSASNYYGGKVNPTHSNDGKVISKQEHGDPHPEVDNYKELKGEDANNKLAYLRGKNFATELKSKLSQLNNIEVGDVKFNWRITDTGGVNDDVRNSNTYPNEGQYVKVKIKATSKSEEREVINTFKPGSSSIIRSIKLKSISVMFNPAPGVLKMHPGQKFSNMTNAISSMLGLSNTKQTVTQYAKKEGA